MVVKNLTDERQKIVVREITGENRKYDIYVEPKGFTEVDRLFSILNPESYVGILEIEGLSVVTPSEEKIAPSVDSIIGVNEEPEESKEDEEQNEVKEDPEEEKVAPDSFFCDICGAEFASARGLASHKNKVHA